MVFVEGFEEKTFFQRENLFVEEKTFAPATLYDLSKTFDGVDHNELISKLQLMTLRF